MLFISCLVLLYTAWRLWRLTIRPSLHPEEPKEVSYWIPYLGPFIAFSNFDEAVIKTIAQLNSKLPFSVTLFGSTLYIISDPLDAAEVNRRSNAFTLEPLAKDMLLKFEISKASTENLFRPLSDLKESARAGPLHATDRIIDLYRQHISPGKELDTFVEGDIIPRMRSILSPEQLGLESGETKTVSLHTLCVQALVNGIMRSYYGDIILQLQPDFAERYILWEKTSWKFLMGLPSFLSRDMLKAKGDIIRLFVEYFNIHREERGHENLWVEDVETLLKSLDLTTQELARIFMLHTSSIIGNMYKLSFWLLAHILHNPELLQSTTSEIEQAFDPDTRAIDHAYLTENCPILDSLYSEVLRLIVTSPMTRYVEKDTNVGGKTLRRGSKVLIMYRQLHLDTSTWGSSPGTLQPDRFLHDKSLKTKPAYRPWNAGKHVCPGRFLAKKAVFAFVGLLLGQYDVDVEPETRFPRADLKKASGVASIADGEDVLVSLRKK